jgi:hypothetical protein
MRLIKHSRKVIPAVCIAAAIMSASVFAKSTTSAKADNAKPAASVTNLKPQTTCPVLGDPIDKKLYVDYKDKRIYVCCAGCIDSVKANPQKYIDKLKAEGQSVEVITTAKKKAKKAAPADSSMKGMDMKDMKM